MLAALILSIGSAIALTPPDEPLAQQMFSLLMRQDEHQGHG